LRLQLHILLPLGGILECILIIEDRVVLRKAQDMRMVRLNKTWIVFFLTQCRLAFKVLHRRIGEHICSADRDPITNHLLSEAFSAFSDCLGRVLKLIESKRVFMIEIFVLISLLLVIHELLLLKPL